MIFDLGNLATNTLVGIIAGVISIIGIVQTAFTSRQNHSQSDNNQNTNIYFTQITNIYYNQPTYGNDSATIIVITFLIGFLVKPYFLYVLLLLVGTTALFCICRYLQKPIYFPSKDKKYLMLFSGSPIIVISVYYVGLWMIGTAPLPDIIANGLRYTIDILWHALSIVPIVCLALQQILYVAIPGMQRRKSMCKVPKIIQFCWLPSLLSSVMLVMISIALLPLVMQAK